MGSAPARFPSAAVEIAARRLSTAGAAATTDRIPSRRCFVAAIEVNALPRPDELRAALIAEGLDAEAAEALARAAADLPPPHVSTPEEIEARRAARRARIERDKAEAADKTGDGSL